MRLWSVKYFTTKERDHEQVLQAEAVTKVPGHIRGLHILAAPYASAANQQHVCLSSSQFSIDTLSSVQDSGDA